MAWGLGRIHIASMGTQMDNQVMTSMSDRYPVGSTGIELPKVVFGTSALGNLYDELDETSKRHIVSSWFEEMEPPIAIDSAGKYGAGLALEELGNALRAQNVSPDRIIISNKLGWKRIPLHGSEPTFEPGVWRNLQNDAMQTISYDGIVECWQQGNELLGPPYSAALLSVHDPDEYLAAATGTADRRRRWNDILDAYRALEDLKLQGMAAAIGVGSKDWMVIRDLVGEIDLDWTMLAGSLTVYTHHREVLEFITELGQKDVFVINSALFNSGFLVGGSYFDYKAVTPGSEPELFRWREGFFASCRDFEVNPADACVEFGLAPKAVKSVAMNTTRPERIAENVKVVKKRAPSEFWESLIQKSLISVTPGELR